MREWEKGWLAGIIDGEGSVGIGVTQGKTKSGLPIFRAQVQMSNCNLAIIEKYVGLLADLGISKVPTLNEREGPRHVGKEYHVTVARLADVERLLEFCLPRLVGKRPQAEIVLRFVRSRMSSPWRHQFKGKRRGTRFGTSYTSEEVDAWRSLSMLNKKRPRRPFNGPLGESA